MLEPQRRHLPAARPANLRLAHPPHLPVRFNQNVPESLGITPDQAAASFGASSHRGRSGRRRSLRTHFPRESSARSSYAWNFGDGQTATVTGASVSHVYAAPATYSVGSHRNRPPDGFRRLGCRSSWTDRDRHRPGLATLAARSRSTVPPAPEHDDDVDVYSTTPTSPTPATVPTLPGSTTPTSTTPGQPAAGGPDADAQPGARSTRHHCHRDRDRLPAQRAGDRGLVDVNRLGRRSWLTPRAICRRPAQYPHPRRARSPIRDRVQHSAASAPFLVVPSDSEPGGGQWRLPVPQ